MNTGWYHQGLKIERSTSKSEMRMKAKELKQAATDAVNGNGNGRGSSFKDLDDLVHHLLSN